MGPQKSDAKKAQQKAARRELQQKKAAAKEQKKRQKQGQVDCDEVPIDILLKNLEEEQKQRQLSKTQATPCSQPSPRAHASLTLVPSGDLLLFGGESYDGKKVRVYGDLFKWDMDKQEWRRLEAPEMPKARCSHQAVYHNDALYVFGGEFSTYYQFHHFKDFWRFDLKTNLWAKVLVDCPTQVPSARSGHRMVVWRGFLVLFGGFHDTGRDTRYYNDLYIFIFSENKWRKIEFPPHAHIPEARGGFVFATVGDVVVLHGGYAKVRDTHKRVQGKTYTDTWILDLKPLAKGALTQTPTWEKVKNCGTPPTPRTGMCATAYKSSVIVFGGVADQDDGGTNLSSTFFNDIYSFDVPKRRWYRLELKSGKKEIPKKQSIEQREQPEGEGHRSCNDEIDSESSSDEDDNWQTTFAYFDAKGRLMKLRLDDLNGDEPGPKDFSTSATVQKHSNRPSDNNSPVFHQKSGGKTSQSVAPRSPELQDGTPSTLASAGSTVEGEAGAAKTEAAPSPITPARPQTSRVFSVDVPLPRLHGILLVRGSNLLLMGGIIELGSKEITLDDCWTLNLNKRDRWVRVLEGTMHEQEWQGAESDAESSAGSSDDDDSNSGSSESSDSDGDSGTSDSDEEETPPHAKGRSSGRLRDEMEKLREQFGLDDPMETPAEGETLRMFFERTKSYWIQKASAAALPGERSCSDGDKNIIGAFRKSHLPPERGSLKSTPFAIELGRQANCRLRKGIQFAHPGTGGRQRKELTRAAFEAASARVLAISDALRCMDELLQKQHSQSEDRPPQKSGKGGGASRQRK